MFFEIEFWPVTGSAPMDFAALVTWVFILFCLLGKLFTGKWRKKIVMKRINSFFLNTAASFTAGILLT